MKSPRKDLRAFWLLTAAMLAGVADWLVALVTLGRVQTFWGEDTQFEYTYYVHRIGEL